ncbi:23S rRNA (guanine745-N1)-methyltransferase [Alkalibacillus filiformis]|uniref:23S rRNA (Guanine745-N1)-methyltransferase n=1 Tax=Alkalibacillus filiformis TaxID=200990 RepID=A0ABU0DX48_9BACI|nr:methyltransferase domain-containing protein [Alkalibacillus filiformis]MDQ0352841.1 23S rRNA (guanine745-N1)-methyltransferase [Alkalibacillus filiformis]
MKKLSKKELAMNRIEKHIDLFQCPVCHETMSADDSKLTCQNRHMFDLAKQGYINMVQQSKKTQYDQSLFEARQRLIQSGFYNQLMIQIESLLQSRNTDFLLDAGCGEGSHLAQILDTVDHQLGVGVDIAKEGIQTAAKTYENAQWIVGDLANTPFTDKAFDAIINILSPSNYQEFTRLIKDSGIVIKVVPGPNYLKELREQIFAGTNQEGYSNEETVARFKQFFHLTHRENVYDEVTLTEGQFHDLIQMTPLTQGIDLSSINFVEPITLDLEILVGKK